MIRLLIAGLACVGLIASTSLLATKLIRARRRGLSVRMQVFLALSMIVLAFAFGLGILVIDRVEARAERLATATAREESHTVAALLQHELMRSDSSIELIAAQLSRGNGASELPETHIEAMGLELLNASKEVLYPRNTTSLAQEEGAVYSDSAIVHGDKTVGFARVVKPVIVVEALLADFAPTVLVICLVLGAASALAAVAIGRAIAAPMEELSLYAKRVSQGERPKLSGVVVGREVNQLVAAIETMRERLEGRPFVETFAADLSHELKNPVAAIRASAEVLEEGALHEPDEAVRFVARIREAAARIEQLLAELLSLAEVETRGPEHLANLSLSSLIEEARLASGESERVEVHSEGEGSLRGDKNWLLRALGNLIDNALIHAPAGEMIQVRVKYADREALITVENSGELAEHVKKSLFKRFVTTRRDRGGSGLGLSIVRAVAEAHGGHIELLAGGPPSVQFRLRLPARPVPAPRHST